MPDEETTSPEIGPELIEIGGIRLTLTQWSEQFKGAGYPGRQPPQAWYEDQGGLAGPTNEPE